MTQSNQAAQLKQVTALASAAEDAREALRDHIIAISEGASEGFLADVRKAAMTGFIASMIARAAKRATKPEDTAAAAAILATKGKARAEAAARMVNAAGQRWFQIMETVRAKAPDAAPKSAAKSQAAVKTAAKRKARAATAGITVTRGRTAKAANNGQAPTSPPPGADVAKTPQAAMTGAMGQAAVLMAYAERNAKLLGAEATKVIKAAAKSILSLPMPK